VVADASVPVGTGVSDGVGVDNCLVVTIGEEEVEDGVEEAGELPVDEI